MRVLESNERVVACATESSRDQNSYFDTYSGRTIRLRGRLHTWFCIYKKEAKKYLDEISPHYFERQLADGTIEVCDSYANFQSYLQQVKGFRLESLPESYRSQYIHYGAFSKNRTIGRSTIWPYRWLSIASGPGLFRSRHELAQRLNALIKSPAAILLKYFFLDATNERKFL
jgi:glutaredoxin